MHIRTEKRICEVQEIQAQLHRLKERHAKQLNEEAAAQSRVQLELDASQKKARASNRYRYGFLRLLITAPWGDSHSLRHS